MCPGIKGKRVELVLLKYNMILEVRDKTCPTLKKKSSLLKLKKKFTIETLCKSDLSPVHTTVLGIL